MQEALKKYFKLIQERVFLKKKNQKKGLSFLKKKREGFAEKSQVVIVNLGPAQPIKSKKKSFILTKGLEKIKMVYRTVENTNQTPQIPIQPMFLSILGHKVQSFQKEKEEKNPKIR